MDMRVVTDQAEGDGPLASDRINGNEDQMLLRT
jgi:hypothetical protein